MQKRNVLNSPRLLEFKKKRQRTILNKILFFLLGFLILFVLFAYLSNLDSLNITETEIVGNKVLDAEMLKTTVKQQITEKYLWLFPKTNVLFYPKNDIKNELWNKFKRIKDINLSIKNNQILIVSLTEREAKYMWCGITPPTELSQNIDNQKCYFLDDSGYLFDEAPYFSGEVYFKFYGLTAENPLGSYFSGQNFKQLVSFKETLVSMEVKPIALYIKNDEEAEIILSRESSSSMIAPKIIFNINSNLKNIEENLDAALNTEPLQSKFKNKYSLLQYIDLRFENKVYYKFND